MSRTNTSALGGITGLSPLGMLMTPASEGENSAGQELNRILWSCTAVSGAFLTLRVICKIYGRLGLWWDDYVLILSWICLLIDTIISNITVTSGYGKPLDQLDMAALPDTIKLGFIAGTFAVAAAAISKTSWALTLVHVLSNNRKMRTLVCFIIVSINLLMASASLVAWIQCIPIAKSWNLTMPGACWDPRVSSMYAKVAGAWSAMMDIVLALLPWPIVYKLKMRRQEKAGVGIAMSLGFVAGIVAWIKVVEIVPTNDPDFFSTSRNIIIWAAAEPAATITAASIPVLRVLLKSVRGGDSNGNASSYKARSLESPYEELSCARGGTTVPPNEFPKIQRLDSSTPSLPELDIPRPLDGDFSPGRGEKERFSFKRIRLSVSNERV